jgi:pimeloyl-ACP methyl ester carboxylesterase
VKFRFSFAAVLLPLLLSSTTALALPVSQQGKNCHLPGSEEGLRCLRLSVPLDPAKPKGEQLSLHVTLAPAFRESARPDPLFVLAGGPGEAGSDIVPLLNNAFRRIRATRDIVLIDQRGTGRSDKLDCPDKPGSDAMTEEEMNAEVRRCIAAIKRPFSAYTTANAAQDIEQVRRALGYGKINVWGGSYGTRLGQAYARAFPDSVRALILDGVAAPDQVIPAGAQDGQAALELLFKQCAQDAACNKAYPALRSEFDALVAKFAAGPQKIEVINPRTAEPLAVTMTSTLFLKTVQNVLYSAQDSRRLPFLLHSAYQGRWAPFIARRNASGDYSSEGGTGLLLHLAVVCAEDYPRLTPALRAEDDKGSFMAGIRTERITAMCKQLEVPAVPYVAPSRIAVPVLMLSGALDPVTPPRRARTAASFMNQVQHHVVGNAGHGISQLGCAPRVMREFLDQPGQAVKGACLSEIPSPSFQVGSAGPQP